MTKKKSYILILSPIIVTAVMAILNLIFYCENDDVFMYHIAQSYGYNNHSEYLVFVNAIIGYIIKFLYQTIPAIDWFPVVYLVILNISFIAVMAVIVSNFCKNDFVNYFVVCFVLGILIYNIGHMTFTMIAYMCCMAGFLLYLDSIINLKKDNIVKPVIGIVFAIFFLFLGFFMRLGQLYTSILVATIPLMVILSFKKKTGVIALVGLVLICVVAKNATNAIQAAYVEDNVNPSFTEFASVRAAASDGGNFTYESYKNSVDDPQLTENDFDLYSYFIYADNETFSVDNVRQISETRALSDKYSITPKAILDTLFFNQTKPNIILGCWWLIRFFPYLILLTIVAFIYLKGKRFQILAASMPILASVAYLFFRLRPVERVINSYCEFGLILLFYIIIRNSDFSKIKLIDDKERPKLFRKKFLKFMVFVLCVSSIAGVVKTDVASVSAYRNRYPIHNYVSSYKYDMTFVCDTLTKNSFLDKHLYILNHGDEDYYKVINTCGDWYIYSDYWYDVMDKYEIGDYGDKGMMSILDDHVLFVCDYEKVCEELVTFFKEHYGYDVTYRCVDSIPNTYIYVYDFNIAE
ncbi:MAG: hypothetical protein IKF64_04860 [Eubacterium sp.]|nr:hypothetical protein [Eubacterium sp.]